MALMQSARSIPQDFDPALLTARLDVVIRRTTKHTLQMMARRHGMTQALMLEAIISHYYHRETAGLGIKELIEYATATKRKRPVTTVTKKSRRK